MLENSTLEAGDQSEQARVLETWALETQLLPGRKIKAHQLVNHRRAFLTLEGALTDNRGSVTRQLEGESKWLSNEPDLKHIELYVHGQCWLLVIQRILAQEFEIEIIEQS